MPTAVAEFCAALAWSYLRWWLERSSIAQSEQRRIALEGLEKINTALDWKASHPTAPSDDPFGDFVRSPADPGPGIPRRDPGKTDPPR
ncbi:MAG: hypothetical protein ACREBG_16725 [Pyrinomonadaceae bacterium]